MSLNGEQLSAAMRIMAKCIAKWQGFDGDEKAINLALYGVKNDPNVESEGVFVPGKTPEQLNTAIARVMFFTSLDFDARDWLRYGMQALEFVQRNNYHNEMYHILNPA